MKSQTVESYHKEVDCAKQIMSNYKIRKYDWWDYSFTTTITFYKKPKDWCFMIKKFKTFKIIFIRLLFIEFSFKDVNRK